MTRITRIIRRIVPVGIWALQPNPDQGKPRFLGFGSSLMLSPGLRGGGLRPNSEAVRFSAPGIRRPGTGAHSSPLFMVTGSAADWRFRHETRAALALGAWRGTLCREHPRLHQH